jgi:molecular chaperone GrpE
MEKSKNKIFGKKHKKDQQDMEKTQNEQEETLVNNEAENVAENTAEEAANTSANTQAEQTPSKEEQLDAQLKEMQDKYMRLMAEFDNFRKRSVKERSELIKTAGEDILVNILPVMDDFERGLAAMETAQDTESLKQGVMLIYNKFKDFLGQRGIKAIEADKQPFDVDVHEALTKIPAPSDDLKGKVVDVIQKGYYLNEKVIRYAKVVVGE